MSTRLKAAATPSGVRPSCAGASTVAAALDQALRDRQQALERGARQRRLAADVALIGIGAAGEQQLHRRQPIVVGREHQQAVAARRRRVRRDAGGEQPRQRLDVAAAGSLGGERRQFAGRGHHAVGRRRRRVRRVADRAAPASAPRRAATPSAIRWPYSASARAEVTDGARDDVLARHLRQAAGDVVDQPLLRVRRLQPVEIAGLHEVVDLARHLRVVSRRAATRRGPCRAPRPVCTGPSNEFGS